MTLKVLSLQDEMLLDLVESSLGKEIQYCRKSAFSRQTGLFLAGLDLLRDVGLWAPFLITLHRAA